MEGEEGEFKVRPAGLRYKGKWGVGRTLGGGVAPSSVVDYEVRLGP